MLWRAVVFALPADAVIWLLANIQISGMSIAEHGIQNFDSLGWLIGLNGVIILAYVIAIPANEIVIPTILMLTVLNAGLSGIGEGAGVMFELENVAAYSVVFKAGGLDAFNGSQFDVIQSSA